MNVAVPRSWVRTAGVAAATASLILTLLIGGAPAPAVASSVPYVGVGATDVATPKSGGRQIFVATTGSDVHKEWKAWYNGGDWREYNRFVCLNDPAKQPSSQLECPEPSMDAPLASIQTAIRIAKPGDVIVVRSGVYREQLGWGARTASATKPVVLQAYPGERVEVNGTLILKSIDYWTVRGIHFTYNAKLQPGEAVVAISGGHGWVFANNEVTGSRGVANLLVESAQAVNSTTAAKVEAAPQNYKITGNCITNNTGTGTRGLYHNIYLMSSIYSTGGVIEHNLLAGAPRGANIKAAASTTALINASPRRVLIRYNTSLYAASGITVGLKAEYVSIEKNLIALPSQSGKYDGGVKTYQLLNPGRNAVKDTLINGYQSAVREDWGVKSHIFMARLDTKTPVSFTGSVANCSVRPTSSYLRGKYGQFAGL